jgi:hypothetical protein
MLEKCHKNDGTDCKKKSEAWVKNAKKGSLNHSTGNATDFNILIDGSSLGKGESYAFLAALASIGRIPPGGIGLYSANDKLPKVELIFKPDNAHPHYDIRTKPNQWSWFKPPGNAKGPGASTLPNTLPKKTFITKDFAYAAKNLKKRIRKIYGELEARKNKNEILWADIQDNNPDPATAKEKYKERRNSPKKSDRLKTLTGKAHADAVKAEKARIISIAHSRNRNAKLLAKAEKKAAYKSALAAVEDAELAADADAYKAATTRLAAAKLALNN